MKKIMLLLAGLVFSCMPMQICANSVEQLANAFYQIVYPQQTGRGVFDREYPSEREIRRRDIMSLKSEDIKKMTPQESRDLLAEILANAIEDLLTIGTKSLLVLPPVKEDQTIQNMITNFPQFGHDMIILFQRLMRKIVNKEYLGRLNTLRDRVQCFNVKEQNRPYLTNKKGQLICQNVDCLKSSKCLQGFLNDLRFILKPFIESLALGLQVGDLKIDGTITQIFTMFAPKMKKELEPIVDSMHLFVQVMEQIEKGLTLTKNASKGTSSFRQSMNVR